MLEKFKDTGKSEFMAKFGESLIFQFHHIHNAMFRLANRRIEALALPIKMEQLPVLMVVYWNESLSQQEIANHVERDKSSVLRTLGTLEKKGLVLNKQDENDGRKKEITLTPTGKYVATKFIDLMIQLEEEVTAALTDRPKKEYVQELKAATARIDLLA